MENVKHNLLVFLFGEQPDWTAMWTAAIALITFVGVIVARRQLVGIRATSRADFTFRFIESFFTCETRTLFSLLINSALTFEVREIVEDGKITNDLTYLRIKPNVVEQISGIIVPPPGKTGYSALELDDLLLGHFESLGWYVKEGLIDFNAAYTTFSYYLEESYARPEIQDYLKHKDNEGLYDELPKLHRRFQARSRRAVAGDRQRRTPHPTSAPR